MKAFDLVIKGGEAVLPGRGRTVCDIAVRDGKIAAIVAPGEAVDAGEALPAHGLVVMPGAVDVHLHLGHGKDIARPRDPLDADRETAAAAKGGITAFVPYLMATEPFEAIFDDVVAVTQRGARIDFGYHFIISTEAQLAGVAGYVDDYGAPSFKIFMNNRGGEGARLGLPDIDDGFLFRLCEAAAKHGGMVCPHPETIEIAWVLRDRLKASDPEGQGRPEDLECDPPAVRRGRCGAARRLCGAHGGGAALCRPYLVSGSSGGGAPPSPRGRARAYRDLPALSDARHLLAGWRRRQDQSAAARRADRERLWQGLASGEIDTVATDHVHRDIAAKAGGIWTASPGCPGLETLLPVLLSEGHHNRGLPLERIVDLAATNPARIMGLGHAKGSIAPGLDADLALVDLKAQWRLQRSDVVSSAGYSIYEGERFTGRVRHALVRGRAVLRDDALVDAAVGHGRYVRRRLPD